MAHDRAVRWAVLAGTVVLATAAGWKAWSRRAVSAAGEAGSSVQQGAAPALFRDVSQARNVRFDHANAAHGDFRLPEEMGSGAALLDYDDDGDIDLFLVQGGQVIADDARPGGCLLRNDGRGYFEDVSAASGSDIAGFGMGCAAGDVDGDGDVDIYVTCMGQDALLFNNGDGTFRKAGSESGIDNDGFGTSTCLLDFDRDGRLDIFVTNYVDWAPHRERRCFDPAGAPDYCSPLDYEAPSIDRLFRNLGGGRFENVTASSGIGSVASNGLGVACSDFDGNGWVDIFVASDLTPGLLWMNQGDGTFLEDGALRSCAFSVDGVAVAGMGTALEDFDSDGDFDLLVTNIRDLCHLGLRNTGALFEDVSGSWGLIPWGVPYTGFGVAAFDQDHDGLLDLFIGNGVVTRLGVAHHPGHDYAEPNQFIRWTPAGRFADASAAGGAALRLPGSSRAVVQGDVDNDGDIDIVVTNNGGPARLLLNDNQAAGAWVQIDAVPAAGGRHALNARIRIQAGGRTWVREVRPHTSYLSSHDPRVHFGLGAAERVTRLTIDWPSGQRESWTDLPINQFHTLTEGSGTPAP